MKKIFFIPVLSIIFLGNVFSQSNNSDTHVPPVVPPPPPKPDTCKLVSLSLPCCVSGATSTASVASVTFDKTPCDASISPVMLTPSGFLGNSVESVTASAGGVSITGSVNVVNPNKKLGFTPLSFNFSQLGKTLDKALDAILSVNSPLSPCKPKGSLIPKGNIGYEWTYICCNSMSPCVRNSHKYSGAASWSYGLNCHFPIAGCPYVASLDAVISASLSGGFSVSYQTGCTAGRWCVGMNMKLSLGGGLGATLLAGFISADLQLVISGGASGQICFPQPVTACATFNIGQVSVVGSVSAMWGLTSHSVDYVIFDGWTTPQFCF